MRSVGPQGVSCGQCLRRTKSVRHSSEHEDLGVTPSWSAHSQHTALWQKQPPPQLLRIQVNRGPNRWYGRFTTKWTTERRTRSHWPPFFSRENTRFEVETSDSGTTAEGRARCLDWRIQSVGGETILTVAVTVGYTSDPNTKAMVAGRDDIASMSRPAGCAE